MKDLKTVIVLLWLILCVLLTIMGELVWILNKLD